MVRPTLDLAERIGRDELTTALFDPEAVSALRAVAAEIDPSTTPGIDEAS
ncbi:hypothetical protein ACIF8W_03020 [Streptomyces sp. NPDC085639]